MNPQPPTFSSWMFWCLLWLAATALVPEGSELVTLGRPELEYQSHNFVLSWGLYHVAPATIGIIIGLFLLRRSPIVGSIGIVVLTLEAAFAILDYRRNGFLGAGEGAISAAAYASAMVVVGAVFGCGWYVFRRLAERAESP